MSEQIGRLYASFPECAHEKTVAEFFGNRLAHDAPKSEPIVSEGPLFLCFTNRCGSTWIGALLAEVGVFPSRTDGHKNFEFFNSDSIVSISRDANIGSMRDYISHLNRFYRGETGCFSTKISVDQLAWITRAGLVRDLMPRPRFLFVRRRNTLAQAISFSIALQTHQWTSNHEGNKVDPEFRPGEILNLHRMILTANAHFEAYFQLHCIKPLEIVYEDVVGKGAEVLSLVGTLIGTELNNRVEREENFSVKKQRTSRNSEWENRMRAEYAATIGTPSAPA
jgi:LPS sulfotransferase NodH